MNRDLQIIDHIRIAFHALYPMSEAINVYQPDADCIRARVYFPDSTVLCFDAEIDFDDETHYHFILADTLIDVRIPFLEA